MDNVLTLHRDLKDKAYLHGPYHAFSISDPKPRDIHKATVRDRLLHHALYRKLYPFFDRTFIADSYSCRKRKGTHRAMNRFHSFAYKVSQNHTRTCWVLKCDVRKFFVSINHRILLAVLELYIPDKDIRWLLSRIIESLHSTHRGVGLPLGNLTSQLFVNIYMNEFDQFVKHGLKAKYYIRYADDFVILSHNRKWITDILPRAERFLRARLKLALHPNKISIRTVHSGVDFLGWVHFPDHRVLRRATRQRMFRNLADDTPDAKVASYLGLLSYGNAYKLTAQIPMLANNA